MGSQTRVGFVVPKFKHSSVERNRLKRRLRELSRTRLLPADVAADVVFRIRPDAYGASFEALTTDVERALVQLQRLQLAAPAPTSPVSPVSDGAAPGTNPGPAA